MAKRKPRNKSLTLALIHNKKNNQLFFALPRRKLKLKKKRIPKKVKVNIMGFKW